LFVVCDRPLNFRVAAVVDFFVNTAGKVLAIMMAIDCSVYEGIDHRLTANAFVTLVTGQK
jgi:hypothetical protein